MSDTYRAEFGVDYLTTTWPTAIHDTIMLSKSNVMDWAQARATKYGKGDWVKPWAWQGYVGYSCGPVQVGERPDGSILRLSSKSANDWLADGFTAGHNVSRIDVALTVWGLSDIDRQIALHSEDAEKHRKTLHSRPYRVKHTLGKGNGDTVNTGDRTSELFTRIYNKYEEMKRDETYATAIRYEAECKEQLGRRVYEQCISGGYSAATCAQVLVGLFARRGISPLCTGGVCGADCGVTVVQQSSLESALSWLDKGVRPTVQRLIKLGYEREVLEALGLPARVENDS